MVSFMILEAGLRFTGFIILRAKEMKNLRNLGSESDYRIMFLGESTTDSVYPDILMYYLRKGRPDKKLSSVNKARSGVNSSIILAQLEDNLDLYNPDMVIVMMGANDDEFIKPYKKESGNKRNPGSFRVVKLLKLMKLHYESKASMRETPGEKNRKAALSGKYLQKAKNNIYGKHDYIAGRRLLEKAVSLDDTNWQAHTELGILYFTHRDCDKAIASLKKAVRLWPDNPMAYGTMGYCYDYLGEHKLAEECFKKANIEKNRFYDVVTEQNYRKLKEVVLSRDIELVYVQYPNLSAQSLKNMLGDTKGIILVDNEKSFKEAIGEESYESYFMDNFAGDFGHCTDKGNKLLARNIANAILENSPSF